MSGRFAGTYIGTLSEILGTMVGTIGCVHLGEKMLVKNLLLGRL